MKRNIKAVLLSLPEDTPIIERVVDSEALICDVCGVVKERWRKNK